MKPTFWLSFLTIALVMTLLLLLRTRLARSERQLGELREHALDAGILEG